MKRKHSELLSFVITILFSIGIVIFLINLIIQNKPTEPDPDRSYRIETVNGLEYPKI